MTKVCRGPRQAPVQSEVNTYCRQIVYNSIDSLALDFNLRGTI